MSVGIQHDWVKHLDNNLYEIRCRVGNNQQGGLYFHVQNDHYVNTHGFKKKSENASKRNCSCKKTT
nr:type II toxin-antitoxin system RelE/ParE family toxin [Companilactobacillus furfuricola]